MTLNPHLTHLQTTGLIRLAQEIPELEYLFRHVLVQDAAYESLLLSDRQQLHQIVGETLEQLYSEKSAKLAPILGQHFINAGKIDKAIHYLCLAGDIAKQAYANEEAIKYYQQALALLHEYIDIDLQAQQESFFDLQEHLGDVLKHIEQRIESRAAYQSVLNHKSLLDPIRRARLHRKMAYTFNSITQTAKVLQAYKEAETALGESPTGDDRQWWQEWIDIQISHGHVYYSLRQPEEMLAFAQKVHIALAQHGSERQKVDYSALLHGATLQRNRYIHLEDTIKYSLLGLNSAKVIGDPILIADEHFRLGFTWLWQGDFDEAEKYLRFNVEINEKIGRPSLIGCTYLCILFRRRNELADMTYWCQKSMELATQLNEALYMGVGYANQAWLAWQRQNWVEVKQLGMKAVALWTQNSGAVYPFQWTALWPLLAVVLREGDVETAVSCAQQLLHPSQQRLPDSITASLEGAIESWQTADSQATIENLQQAIQVTQAMGLF